MRPELIPFRAEHLLDLRVLSAEEIELAVMEERRKLIAFTVMVNGQVIGCAGVSRAYGGVYAAWAFFSDEIRSYPKWLHQTVLAYLTAVRRMERVSRLEALVLSESCRNCRWIERLGFRFESVALKAGINGEDCRRYYWVKESQK